MKTQKIIERALRKLLNEYGEAAAASGTDPTDVTGFYPYNIERGSDIHAFWYKSPGRPMGSDGDPCRPEDAPDYIGLKPKISDKPDPYRSEDAAEFLGLKSPTSEIEGSHKESNEITVEESKVSREVEHASQNVVKKGWLDHHLYNEQLQSDNEDELEVAKEAPKSAPLGRIAFAQHRIDKVPHERNTSCEDELYSDIVAYFRNVKKIDKKAASDIKKCMRKGWYASVFKQPKAMTVYRGMCCVTDEWLKKALGKKFDDSNDDLWHTVNGQFTFKPIGGVSSSWTTDKNIAYAFTLQYCNGRSVLMYANTDDNQGSFAMGRGGLYRLDEPQLYSNENEVMGLGNINVCRIDWQ